MLRGNFEEQPLLYSSRAISESTIPREATTKGGKMGLPNKDEIEGKFDQAKGATKETVGRTINDRDLEEEGNADRTGGKVQEGFGKARRKVGETIEDIGEAVRK